MLQRREENPHQQPGSHGGVGPSAHHIIAHSKLVAALNLLDPEQKKEVLAESVPRAPTPGMLKNSGIKFVNEGQYENLTEHPDFNTLVDRLRDKDDLGDYNNTRLADVRASFFEWQGGNQFMGPNTDFRPEPKDSKDELDSDARYLPGPSKRVEDLLEEGKELDELLGENAPNAKDIKNQLLSIVRMTRDIVPAPFDADQWVELDSLRKLKFIERITGRGHLEDYAHFKLALSDYPNHPEIIAGQTLQDKPTYRGVQVSAINTATVTYMKVSAARHLKPTENQPMTLGQALAANGFRYTTSGESTIATLPETARVIIGGNKVRPGDLSAPLDYSKQEGDTFTLSTPSSSQVTRKVTQESLFDYCKRKGFPVTSYVPKGMIDNVKRLSTLHKLKEDALRLGMVNSRTGKDLDKKIKVLEASLRR